MMKRIKFVMDVDMFNEMMQSNVLTVWLEIVS